MKVIKHIINSIRTSANFNPEAQTRPHCILWPDKERQWENAISRIMPELPELLILGEYNPQEKKGPAIWIRAAIAGLVEGFTLPFGRIPVIYLPGVSRQDLRAVEQCPNELKPLAELQYRGVIWSQINARDWTILSYLKTKKGGLGLNVSQDEATLQAMMRAIVRILEEDLDSLKIHHLDKDFFNSLISGFDTVKEILLWMSDPETFRAAKTIEEWQGFIEICKSKYKFDPEQDGVLAASEKLGSQDEAWGMVWNRFCEAPARYEGIPEVLKKTVIPLNDNYNRFPQWNEQKEESLRKDLLMLSGMTEQTARETINKLENEHAERRFSVWAQLGQAPLALALKWISEIAIKSSAVIIGDFAEIAKAQDTWGWHVDNATVSALACVKKLDDIEAVTSAIRSVYLPWIDTNARNLQKAMNDKEENSGLFKNPEYSDQECVFFIDGLRFDLAKRLSTMLRKNNWDVQEDVVWNPLPTVTATCKPALMPIADKIIGDDSDYQDFTPVIKHTGKLATSSRVNNLMQDQGWSILTDVTLDKQDTRGWYEFGRIDEEGHKIGSRIANQVEGYINEVEENVHKIFNAGWKKVKIVSDHGWLWMPGGLPKVPMPTSLTESKWGRCAAIKPGALYEGTYYPWYWNETVHFALADGVGCYRSGVEYSHGGISIQECLMLQLTVKKKEELEERNVLVTDIVWRGMRCNIAAEGDIKGVTADVRLKAAVPESSIVMGPKGFNGNGIASVVVDVDSAEGKTAYVVLLDPNNKVIYQSATVVGGE